MKNKSFRAVFVLKLLLFLSKFRKKFVKNPIFNIFENNTVTLLRLPFQTKWKKQNQNISIFRLVEAFGVSAYGGHLGLIASEPLDRF